MTKNRYWTELTRHAPALLRDRFADTIALLAFLTVIPLAPKQDETPDFSRVLRAMPLAGLAIGAVGGAGLLLASAFHLPVLLVATLTVALLVAVTGALHEDALSDVADGFGGGGTRERKLEIMRDSRLGTFGAAALVMSLLVRIAALAGLLDAPAGAVAGAAAVIAAAVLSRTSCVAVVTLLPPARADGLGARAGQPGAGNFNEAVMIAAVLAGIALVIGVGLAAVAAAFIAAVLAAGGMIVLARAQIGGQTGDVAGACQQAVECAVLVAIAGAAGL